MQTQDGTTYFFVFGEVAESGDEQSSSRNPGSCRFLLFKPLEGRVGEGITTPSSMTERRKVSKRLPGGNTALGQCC